MTNKLFKYQLFFLFIISTLNISYYFFASSLPDNALLISNSSSEVFSFSYFLSSIVAYFSYFSGPWILAPLFCVAFVYTFICSKRDLALDSVIPATVSVFFYFSSVLIFPSSLGKGLFQISDGLFSTYTVFALTLFFGFLSLYFILNNNLIVLLKSLQYRLENFGLKCIASLARKFKRVRHSKKSKQDLPKVATITDNSIDSSVSSSSKLKSIVEKVVKPIDDIKEKVSVVKENLSSTSPSISESSIKVTTEGSDVDKIKPEELSSQSKNTTKTSNNIAFNSEELISFISSSSSISVESPDDDYFHTIIKAIEDKLNEFKISAKIINVLKGPVVDTFELDLGEGVKLSKVLNVSDDIGLALNGVPIRIVYPLKGKTTIGIEVPRNPREFIFLDEVLKSKAFNDSQYRLPVAMGKDAYGNTKVVDLAGMPHMLVAGATGAGKSVFINALLTSLIVKKTPEQLKLILIDPKQLELATFQELPHLMLPVLTDPKSSSIALLWLVQEMDKRYTILKDMGVKNIEGFNKKIKNASPAQLSKIACHYEDSRDAGYEMPYIVCVIDEFADLILTKMGKEIEINVNRLAAKARAAGIHMVVATQRPSTDVVTGVIKANFPTRVAFRVTTGHDSKTILDQYGAQKLLGRGDMLYKHGVELLRLHSSFVEEDEIEGLVSKLASIPSEYNESAVNFLDNGGDEEDHTENGEVKTFLSGTTDDPVYDEAVQIVMQKGSASASMLQRALRVGYNRAANIIDEMERSGIVGPAQGSKPRQVLARSE